jgi:hypothetical protein
MPPWSAGVVTGRTRTRVPPLQAAVQSSQSPQLPKAQSTGHGASLHAMDSDRAVHESPPHAGWTLMERVCVCEPPPQVREHDDHDSQPVSWQFTGQQCVLHALCSTITAQSCPPQVCCVTTARVRTLSPDPHMEVHALHSDHDDRLQSTGQHAVLHST